MSEAKVWTPPRRPFGHGLAEALVEVGVGGEEDEAAHL